mmetsp:Transcript_111590/g.266202  ORF Transcript_111590/g.266202 Transcript_111590/m.266202 type:complete len:228 (+) Transcript_111590:556-1239(+)
MPNLDRGSLSMQTQQTPFPQPPTVFFRRRRQITPWGWASAVLASPQTEHGAPKRSHAGHSNTSFFGWLSEGGGSFAFATGAASGADGSASGSAAWATAGCEALSFSAAGVVCCSEMAGIPGSPGIPGISPGIIPPIIICCIICCICCMLGIWLMLGICAIFGICATLGICAMFGICTMLGICGGASASAAGVADVGAALGATVLASPGTNRFLKKRWPPGWICPFRS